MKTMETNLENLQARVADLIANSPEPKARWRAIKSVRWCLYSPQLNLWAGLQGLEIVPVTSQDQAAVFTGQDNEQRKIDFYTAATGIAWQVQLV